MKKIFYLLLIIALPNAVSALEKVKISGKITNMGTEKLKVQGLLFYKEIALKPDGSFSETLEIEYPGKYNVYTLSGKFPIYIARNAKISFAADDKDLLQTIKFSGTYYKENQYLARKAKFEGALTLKQFYMLGEKEYFAKIKEYEIAALSATDNNMVLSEEFRTLERNNARYARYNYLKNYEETHRYVSGDRDFKVSADFPKPEPVSNLDSEADFAYSNEYSGIVINAFAAVAKSTSRDTIAYPSKLPFDQINTFKSQLIRNMIMEGFTYGLTVKNPLTPAIFNDLMKEVTSTLLRAQITAKYEAMKMLAPGNPSAKFDYENHKGGKTSLDNFSGKYVYIDVWATWCGPCREEIPALEKIEKQYDGKNIAFVSISIDYLKDRAKWKKMIDDNNMQGIQLLADNQVDSAFIKAYNIESIPRFILIDPQGKIVDFDAPRPSDPKLVDLFNDLKI